jgi:hypothetical protein
MAPMVHDRNQTPDRQTLPDFHVLQMKQLWLVLVNKQLWLVLVNPEDGGKDSLRAFG